MTCFVFGLIRADSASVLMCRVTVMIVIFAGVAVVVPAVGIRSAGVGA